MTPEKIVQVLVDIRRELPATMERFPSDQLVSTEHEARALHLAHIHWMTVVTETMALSDGATGKVNRWLGFIQGVLWVTGRKTIDQLREMNMP